MMQNLLLCPVCHSSRNKGNHQKCSKITYLKYQKKQAETQKEQQSIANPINQTLVGGDTEPGI